MLKLLCNLKKKTINKITLSEKVEEPVVIYDNNYYNYVINLNRRKDRWDNFLKTINKTILKNEKFIKIEAFDGNFFMSELKRVNILNNTLIKNIIDSCVKNINHFRNKGEIGCLISHLIVIQTIINNENIKEEDYVTIYEDDIVYCKNFETNYKNLKKLDLNKLNIEFLYLGGRHSEDYNTIHKSLEKIDDNVYFRNNSIIKELSKKTKDYKNWDRCTFSYIIRKSCCYKILDNIYKSIEEHNSLLAIDHLYVNNMDNLLMFDYLPHLFYSPSHGDSDIQKIKKYYNNKG